MKTTLDVVTKELTKRRSKEPPELQLHASATLVAPGDPFALNEIDRKDLAGEIGQFCVPIEPKWVGRLKRHHIDMAFESLKKSIYQKLRDHGVMAAGE